MDDEKKCCCCHEESNSERAEIREIEVVEESCCCHADDKKEEACHCHEEEAKAESCSCHADEKEEGACHCHEKKAQEEACHCHDHKPKAEACHCHTEDSCHCHGDDEGGAHSCCGGGDKSIGKLSSRTVDLIIVSVSAIAVILSFVFSKTGVNTVVDVAWVSIVLSGVPIVYAALKSLIKRRKITSALLVSTALIAACAIGEYFAAGEVALIMMLGELLEDLTLDKANKNLKSLLKLAPTTARRIKDGETEEIDASELCEGDIIRVLAGESVAADGVVLSGVSAVNQAAVTGESVPVEKRAGDSVFQGTVNTDGVLEISISRTAGDSTIAKMAQLVREAERNKAPVVKIADKLASYMVPMAIIIALIVGLVTKDVERAVTVLVVFCPCSLVLATPTAIMASIGLASKNGVIVRSGHAMENLSRLDGIVFDKTGTITTGELEVAETEGELARTELLRLAASLDSLSVHPIAKAIVAAAESEGIVCSAVEEFENVGGRGVSGVIDGKRVLLGNARYLREEGVSVAHYEERTEQLASEGRSLIYVAVDGKASGYICVRDNLREEAVDVISEVRQANITATLLTGDHRESAKAIADQLNVDYVIADALPQDKCDFIAKKTAEKVRVAMVGDGVNDAPALKAATVGIAMGGGGTDIAVESADVVLMDGTLKTLPRLLGLSKRTYKTILLNISFSMLVNVTAILLASFGKIDPVIGALVHNAGSVLVVGNSALLALRKF